MALSDPIADFLTRIRNAIRAERSFVDADWSKMKESIARVLKEEGFIDNSLVQKDENGRGKIRVFLRYGMGRVPVIKGLERVSRPGLRHYIGHQEIPNFHGGLGLAILSTSQGVLAGKDASKRKLGGELLCRVW